MKKNIKIGITIEPILNFDMPDFSDLIIKCNPSFVYIGADSKRHNLPEPPEDKIIALVNSLREAKIEVRLKSNLKRLAPSLFLENGNK